MAYFRCGSGGGTITIQEQGTSYRSEKSISCKENAILVFIGNFSSYTPTNMDLLANVLVNMSSSYVRCLAFKATSETCSLKHTVHGGNVGYMVFF